MVLLCCSKHSSAAHEMLSTLSMVWVTHFPWRGIVPLIFIEKCPVYYSPSPLYFWSGGLHRVSTMECTNVDSHGRRCVLAACQFSILQQLLMTNAFSADLYDVKPGCELSIFVHTACDCLFWKLFFSNFLQQPFCNSYSSAPLFFGSLSATILHQQLFWTRALVFAGIFASLNPRDRSPK